MAAVYNLYIINKSGCLIFHKNYGSAGRMDTNDSLRLASLWHSMHAISQQLSPVFGCSGIELLQAYPFDLHCFQSLTGSTKGLGCITGKMNCSTIDPDKNMLRNVIRKKRINLQKRAVKILRLMAPDRTGVTKVCVLNLLLLSENVELG